MTIERNGLGVVDPVQRTGTPRRLFWPWCASNISVLSISYGAIVLGLGVGVLSGILAAAVGAVASFVLVGLVSLAGKRGSAPTMALSRAAFGVRGNALPAVVSYLLTIGWEIALVALATLATATVFGRLGIANGDLTKVIAFLVVAGVTVAAGVLGYDVIMRLQTWLTVLLAVATVGYIALTADQVDVAVLAARPAGSAAAVVGAAVLIATALGIGWVNAAADYSRYLPRETSGRSVVGWTTLGGSVAPIVLVTYGVLLAGSDPRLADAISADPIGALTTVLPTWYLVPMAVVAVGGLVAGAVLNIYSSGLTLLSLGVPVSRAAAAGFDGVLMVLGTVWVVWFAPDVLGPFQGFLITLGVPISAWCGVFLGDLALRRRGYAEAELYSAAGRYGAARPSALAAMVLATAIGWGLVTATTPGLDWQGYLLRALGIGEPWSEANLGVLAALAVGFVLAVLTGRSRVAHQELRRGPGDGAPAREATPR